jgi:hypothetical protein
MSQTAELPVEIQAGSRIENFSSDVTKKPNLKKGTVLKSESIHEPY